MIFLNGKIEELTTGTPTTINFYEIDTETFDDNFVGTLTIESDKITASDSDILDMVESMVSSAKEALNLFSSWSNGYLRSEIPIPEGGP